MLESFYESALAYELQKLGHKVLRQVKIPVTYKGIEISNALSADIVVDDMVIVELKAQGQLHGVEFRQLLSYLTLTGLHLGYIINFGVEEFSVSKCSKNPPMDKGIYRVVLNI